MAGIKNKDILKCIGVKVQEARRNKNYTQEFVAEKVDRSCLLYTSDAADE